MSRRVTPSSMPNQDMEPRSLGGIPREQLGRFVPGRQRPTLASFTVWEATTCGIANDLCNVRCAQIATDPTNFTGNSVDLYRLCTNCETSYETLPRLSLLALTRLCAGPSARHVTSADASATTCVPPPAAAGTAQPRRPVCAHRLGIDPALIMYDNTDIASRHIIVEHVGFRFATNAAANSATGSPTPLSVRPLPRRPGPQRALRLPARDPRRPVQPHRLTCPAVDRAERTTRRLDRPIGCASARPDDDTARAGRVGPVTGVRGSGREH